MICQNCKNDSECLSATVYYAETKNSSSQKAYGNINETEVFVCKDCLIKKNRKNAFLYPLASIAIPFLLYFLLRMTIGTGLLTQVVIIITVIISAITFVFSLINLLTKGYMKINDSDVYNLAHEILKKEFQINSPKTLYEFWPKYPKQMQ